MSPTVQACSVCHRLLPDDMMVQLDGQWVCADCKPDLVQRTTEGAALTPEDRERLVNIAREHRRLVLLILPAIAVFAAIIAVALLSTPPAGEPPGVIRILALAQPPLMVLFMVLVFRLVRALYSTETAIILVIVMLIPWINFIALLILSHSAQNELKSHGIRVGFLGAKAEDAAVQLNLR